MSQDNAPSAEAISPQERQHLIEEAAYRRYQQRGRQPGSSLDDWLKAETEIDHMLASRLHTGDSHPH